LTRAAWNPTTGMEEIVQAERRSAPGPIAVLRRTRAHGPKRPHTDVRYQTL
jgi:hypothetical protein